MFRYKVEYSGIFTYAYNGIELDSVIKDMLGRGCKMTDIHVTVEVAPK